MSDFNYQEYLKNNPLLQKEVKENKLITESQEEVQEYVETSGDPVGDDLKKLAAFVKKGGSKAKDALKKFVDSIEVGSMQQAMASEELEVTEEEVTEEEIQEEVPSSKMKVSELKAKIKEDIISLLNEEDEEIDAAADEIEPDDAEIDVEDEVEADIEAPAPSSDAGLSKDEQDIQDSLKVAYDKAVSIGDEKLADQIGNSITFFTRTHVVER
jgi:hypothetical protein